MLRLLGMKVVWPLHCTLVLEPRRYTAPSGRVISTSDRAPVVTVSPGLMTVPTAGALLPSLSVITPHGTEILIVPDQDRLIGHWPSGSPHWSAQEVGNCAGASALLTALVNVPLLIASAGTEIRALRMSGSEGAKVPERLAASELRSTVLPNMSVPWQLTCPVSLFWSAEVIDCAVSVPLASSV